MRERWQNRWRATRVWLVGMLIGSGWFSGGVSGQSIDPLNPAEWQARERANTLERSRWPGRRVTQLEAEIQRLQAQLSRLPRQYPVTLQNRLGFHSALETGALDAGAAERGYKVHQLDFVLTLPFTIQAIGIAPAANPYESGPKAYGFPPRFKIEVLTASGEFDVVADWLDEDFPDPGTLPVVFSDLHVKTRHIRMTVPEVRSESRMNYFALGEFFIWGGNGESFFAENLAIWDSTQVTASAGFSLPPQWELSYLTDGVSGLGFPLGQEASGRKDLMILSTPGAQLAETVEVMVDLGEPKEISRFDLWPAKSLDGLALSGVGFPGEVTVDVSNDRDFKNYRPIEQQGVGNRGRTGALFSICVRPPEARYLRVTLSGLPTMDGERVLGLGEIALYDLKGDLVSGRVLPVSGIPAVHQYQLPRLLDGYCWGRQILSDLEWFEGLARRRPLEQRLAVMERELVLAAAIWHYLQLKLWVGGAVFVSLGLVGFILFQNAHKKKLLRKQADQFRRDLHDEVGSSLGGIALLADELADQPAGGVVATDLGDLSFMAREASASLGEIIKVGDQGPILLSALLLELQQRAKRVLRGPRIELVTDEPGPDLRVSLNVKRHITMFFKEGIHNCARHARASHVRIETLIKADQLWIEIRDDGCGFDPARPVNGWGLSNMRQRAEELGGHCIVRSGEGEGTRVAMQVPLKRLTQEPRTPYQSSNS